MPRIFIALPVSAEAKNELELAQNEIAKLNPKLPVKWTEKHNLHVTLQFLGGMEDTTVEEIKDGLREVAGRHQAFNFWLKETGGFPNLNRPHVLVVFAGEEGKRDESLYQDIAALTAGFGVKTDEYRWRPHITFGRIKRECQTIGLARIKIEPVSWRVGKFDLLSSELGAGGPKYTLLEEYNLLS